MEIYSDETTTRIAGEDWHSDVSCDPEPPMGTILQMLEVPPAEETRCFPTCRPSSSRFAVMQQFLEGLNAVHDGKLVYRDRYEGCGGNPGRTRGRTSGGLCSPGQWRKVLFVNRIFTSRIVELGEAESERCCDCVQRIEQPDSSAVTSGDPDRSSSGTIVALSTMRCGTTIPTVVEVIA
ncbi:MAG: hypothetical protein Ct9H300mP1_34980 [Planctomycetaceae bacterium]|nr:MAG: hypothetical protein Ct9H300mP1_34980 [Planctomycetaceae bacterium]